jgi:hypothetical protein
MLGTKVRDKKTHFVEPANKVEQESWLDGIIQDISQLGKKEYADLLASEIDYMLNLLIPVLE